MTKDEAIEKVKKLLALSDSPNEHEAALAAVMAKKILTAYNISGLDINEETGKADFIKEFTIEVERIDEWMTELYKAVQQLYNCEVFIQFGKKGPGTIFLVFMGEAANAKIAAYVTDYLVKTIDRMASEAYEATQTPKPRWVDVSFAWNDSKGFSRLFRPVSRLHFIRSYRVGATMRIIEDILAQIERTAQEQALVPYMKEAIAKHVKEEYGSVSTLTGIRGGGSDVDVYAASMGYEDGKGISPKPAIEGGRD